MRGSGQAYAGGIPAAASLPRSGPTDALAHLRALVGVLPLCRDFGEALIAIEQGFIAWLGFPVAILSGAGARTVLHHTPGLVLDDSDFEAAACAVAAQRAVHRSSGVEHRYFIPLQTCRGPVGAFAFAAAHPVPRRAWPSIQSFAHQTSLTLLRSELADEARHANLLSEADRFQKALLNSIAHNVRTPLASIIGVLSTLQEDGAALNGAIRRDLVDTARQEADRLNRLLGNLLDFSRIQSGAVQVRADPCDVQDVIGAALEQLGAKARERTINVTIAPDLPLVRMDFALIVQVLVNILDNALKYSATDAPIAIRALLAEGALEMRVEDNGDGIAEEALAHVFDKFNRAGRTGETGGIGLGLSICKGLIEAHRGEIWAERRTPHGSMFAFRVPHIQERER
jgi:two-component system sensor histidine kinase KdpD